MFSLGLGNLKSGSNSEISSCLRTKFSECRCRGWYGSNCPKAGFRPDQRPTVLCAGSSIVSENQNDIREYRRIVDPVRVPVRAFFLDLDIDDVDPDTTIAKSLCLLRRKVFSCRRSNAREAVEQPPMFISLQDFQTPSRGQCLDCHTKWKEQDVSYTME